MIPLEPIKEIRDIVKMRVHFATTRTHSSQYLYVRSKAAVLLLLTICLLLLPLWESVIVLCFVVRYFMSILVLQSS